MKNFGGDVQTLKFESCIGESITKWESNRIACAVVITITNEDTFEVGRVVTLPVADAGRNIFKSQRPGFSQFTTGVCLPQEQIKAAFAESLPSQPDKKQGTDFIQPGQPDNSATLQNHHQIWVDFGKRSDQLVLNRLQIEVLAIIPLSFVVFGQTNHDNHSLFPLSCLDGFSQQGRHSALGC